MKQSRERSPRSLRTTAKLFQASTALAIPLLRALAKPPMNDRIGAPQVCADTESAPALTIQQLIQREMSFHTATFAIFDNQALIYLSALLHERLDGSLPGIALPIASSAPDTSPPPFREIVDLVSNGYGNEAVRSAHHRAHRIYALVSGQSHDPILTAVRTAEPGEIMH
jgi:hypothetical protein